MLKIPPYTDAEHSLSVEPRTTTERSGLIAQADTIEITGKDHINDVPVFMTRVTDKYLDGSEQSLQKRQDIQRVIGNLEQALGDEDPQIVNEAVRSGLELLDSSPTIRAWKGWMTTAMALYPLQRPTAKALLDGTPVDSFARDLFLHGQDAVGIRDRGALFAHLLRERDGRVQSILSLASGAAVPECDAIRTMAVSPRAVFVDMDTRALGHVRGVAAEAGLSNDTYTTIIADLIKDFMFARDPGAILPEPSFDIVDALGITEYFKDRHMKLLLEKAYQFVTPGGALIFGNMLDTHPTLRFNKQIVEWPGVNPRSKETLTSIAAEISGVGNVEVYIPESGVYAVVKMEKPSAVEPVRQLGSTALVG